MKTTKHYLEDFQGLSAGSSILLAGEASRLPDQPCKFVMLSNFNVLDDVANTAKPDAGAASFALDDQQEIYYGFAGAGGAGGRLVGQLFVGASTELLPVNNCNQIVVKSRAGKSSVVYYAWFY